MQRENAVQVALTTEQEEMLKKRIIENQYMELLLKNAKRLCKYKDMSIQDILLTVPIPVLLKEVDLGEIKFEISVYRLPDTSIIEIDRVSGYFAFINDKSDLHQKICDKFNI